MSINEKRKMGWTKHKKEKDWTTKTIFRLVLNLILVSQKIIMPKKNRLNICTELPATSAYALEFLGF